MTLSRIIWNRADIAEYILVFGLTLFFDKELICAVLSLLVLGRSKCLIYINWKFLLLFSVIFSYAIFTTVSNSYGQNKTVQQTFLIGVFFQVYYSVFLGFRDRLPSVFAKYLNVSYFMSVYALVFFVLGRHRANSWLIEPSYFAMLITPATAYYVLYSSFRNVRTIVIVMANLLSFSTASVAILCVIFFCKYVIKKNIIYKCLFVLLSMVLISSSYILQNVENEAIMDINMKIDESVTALSYTDISNLESLNASTYALFANWNVAIQAPNRFLGTGLGTHEQSYELIYPWTGFELWGLNATDAYSLFVRILSEFGIVGISIFILFLINHFNRNNAINVSVLFVILYDLLRGGHYVLYGTVFFVFLYYYTSKIQLK